jgi:hypothetical protein
MLRSRLWHAGSVERESTAQSRPDKNFRNQTSDFR